jgi:hypothetical protein
MASDTQVHELAGGEIFVWQELPGVIMLDALPEESSRGDAQ